MSIKKQDSVLSQIKIPVKDSSGKVLFLDFLDDENKDIEKSEVVKEEAVLQKQEPADFGKASSVLQKQSSDDDSGAQDINKPHPNHWFDAEDELELSKINPPKVKKLDDKLLKKESLDIAKQYLQGEDEKFVNRLALMIFVFWKDLKNYLKTKEALMRKRELGGMGFDEEKADTILKHISDKKKQFLESLSTGKTQEVQTPRIKDMTDKQSFLNPKTNDKELSKSSLQSKPTDSPDMDYGTMIDDKNLYTEIKPRHSDQGAFSDIKSGTLAERGRKLISPIKELEMMNLETFRKLGKNTADSIQRIKQKITLLGDESVKEMAKGIKAFKNSPLYRDYLKIGHTGIEKSMSIQDVIDQKLVCDMTMDEFNAISDLSKHISF